jgi:hypothetical protein
MTNTNGPPPFDPAPSVVLYMACPAGEFVPPRDFTPVGPEEAKRLLGELMPSEPYTLTYSSAPATTRCDIRYGPDGRGVDQITITADGKEVMRMERTDGGGYALTIGGARIFVGAMGHPEFPRWIECLVTRLPENVEHKGRP